MVGCVGTMLNKVHEDLLPAGIRRKGLSSDPEEIWNCVLVGIRPRRAEPTYLCRPHDAEFPSPDKCNANWIENTRRGIGGRCELRSSPQACIQRRV